MKPIGFTAEFKETTLEKDYCEINNLFLILDIFGTVCHVMKLHIHCDQPEAHLCNNVVRWMDSLGLGKVLTNTDFHQLKQIYMFCVERKES